MSACSLGAPADLRGTKSCRLLDAICIAPKLAWEASKLRLLFRYAFRATEPKRSSASLAGVRAQIQPKMPSNRNPTLGRRKNNPVIRFATGLALVAALATLS